MLCKSFLSLLQLVEIATRLIRYQKKLGNVQQKIYENTCTNTGDFHKVGTTEFFIQWSWHRSFWRIAFIILYILWLAAIWLQRERIWAAIGGGRRRVFREGTHHPLHQQISTVQIQNLTPDSNGSFKETTLKITLCFNRRKACWFY